MVRCGRLLSWGLLFSVSLASIAGCASVTDVLTSVNNLAAMVALLADILAL